MPEGINNNILPNNGFVQTDTNPATYPQGLTDVLAGYLASAATIIPHIQKIESENIMLKNQVKDLTVQVKDLKTILLNRMTNKQGNEDTEKASDGPYLEEDNHPDTKYYNKLRLEAACVNLEKQGVSISKEERGWKSKIAEMLEFDTGISYNTCFKYLSERAENPQGYSNQKTKDQLEKYRILRSRLGLSLDI